jgi:hypothetical protein
VKQIEGRKAIEGVMDRVSSLAPVTFMVPLQGTLAVYLIAFAQASGCKPETILAEAFRAYVGDAA